jgi:hypothetical protein
MEASRSVATKKLLRMTELKVRPSTSFLRIRTERSLWLAQRKQVRESWIADHQKIERWTLVLKPVYDILDCGPRHRFYANGKLVHNSNWQNFKRVDSRNRGASIREAILPPEGFDLVDPDLSQVECRVLHYLADDKEALDEFRRGEDPYLKLASAAYGYAVTKAMPEQRGTGKQLKLSCGFQAGAKTIQRTARLGTYGPPVIIDLETATRWRDIYRSQNRAVVKFWSQAEQMIKHIANDSTIEWGPFSIKNKRVYLPNGLFINYETLEWHVPTQEEINRAIEKHKPMPEPGWRLKMRNGWSKLYAGKLTENVVQFAARAIASQAFLRILALGYRIVNTEHDKHWVLIPQDGNAAQHCEIIRAEMIRTPDWLPGIPLDCECKVPV